MKPALKHFLLILGILPFWHSLRESPPLRRALLGVNAAVVGLLVGAFINPVFSSGILSVGVFIMAVIAFAMLVHWKTPPWLVVGFTGVLGSLTSIL